MIRKWFLVSMVFILGSQPIFIAIAENTPEFKTRQDSLLKILDLTILELKDLDKKLELPKFFPGAKLIIERDALKDRLEGFRQLTENLRAQTADALAEDEIKNIAADLKLWREEVYQPAVVEVLNLYFLFRGTVILATADERFSKITRDVNKLEEIFKESARPLRTELVVAAEGLSLGHEKFFEAQEAFLDKNDPKPFLSAMLDAVKDAYQKFYAMAQMAQTLLRQSK